MRKRLLTAALLVLAGLAAKATTYYVDAGVEASGDGLSWSTAYKTMAEGYAKLATNGNKVLVKKGEYTWPGTFQVPTGSVTLYGGLEGTEDDMWTPDANWAPSAYSVCDGTTATAGTTPFISFKGNGAVLKLAGIHFKNRTAKVMGVALNQIRSGGSLVQGCVFENLVSTYVETANVGYAYGGGAVYVYNDGGSSTLTTVTFNKCKFISCQSAERGGAMFLYPASDNRQTIINGCEFYGNKAVAGGAIGLVGGRDPNTACSTEIKNCIFAGNSVHAADATLDKTNLIPARTPVKGGAFYHDRDKTNPISFVNCLFADNHSDGTDGGVYLPNGTAKIYNSIFYNNTAGEPSTVSNLTYASGTPTFKNNIIAAGTYSGITPDASNITENVSDMSAMFTAAWLPKLGFPGVDAGTASGVTLPATDFAGGPRTQNGTVDIGPYEAIAVTASSITAGANVTITEQPAEGYYVYGDTLRLTFTVAAGTLPAAEVSGSTDYAVEVKSATEYKAWLRLTAPTTITLTAVGPKAVTLTPNDQLTVTGASTALDGTAYKVPDGEAFWLTYTVNDSYDTAGVTITPAAAYTLTEANGTYTLTIPAVSEDITVALLTKPMALRYVTLTNSSTVFTSTDMTSPWTWDESSSRYAVYDRRTFTLSVAPHEGYVLKAAIDGEAPFVPTMSGGAYAIAMSNLTADHTLTLTDSLIRLTITATASAGITDLILNSAEVNYFEEYTTPITFKLANGYHSPKLALNGAAQTLGEPDDNGVYSFTITGQVKENKSIYIMAFAENVVPVRYDFQAMTGQSSTGQTIGVGRQGGGAFGLFKFDFQDYNPTDNANKATLKLRIQTPVSKDSTYDVAWRSNYTVASSYSGDAEYVAGTTLWTESVYGWNDQSRRPAALRDGLVTPVRTRLLTTTTDYATFDIADANYRKMYDFLASAEDGNRAWSLMMTCLGSTGTALPNVQFYSHEGAEVAANVDYYPVIEFSQVPVTLTVADYSTEQNILAVTTTDNNGSFTDIPFGTDFTFEVEVADNFLPSVEVDGNAQPVTLKTNGATDVYTVTVPSVRFNATLTVAAIQPAAMHLTHGAHTTITAPAVPNDDYGTFYVSQNSALDITFTVAEGYGFKSATVDGADSTAGVTFNAGVYKLHLANVGTGKAIVLTDTLTIFSASATAADGFAFTAPPAATVACFAEYSVEFTIPAGQHSPLVKVTEAGIDRYGYGQSTTNNTYIYKVSDVRGNIALNVLGAYPDSVLPVMEDTYVSGATTSENNYNAAMLITRQSTGAQYVRRSYLAFNAADVAARVAAASYNRVDLRLVSQQDPSAGGSANDNYAELRTLSNPAALPAMNAMTWSANSEGLAPKDGKVWAATPAMSTSKFAAGTVINLNITDSIKAAPEATALLSLSPSGSNQAYIYYCSLENGDLTKVPQLVFSRLPSTVTLAAGDSVRVLGGTEAATEVAFGETYTATFGLPAGAFPRVTVDNAPATATDNGDGTFSVTLTDIRAPHAVAIHADVEVNLSATANATLAVAKDTAELGSTYSYIYTLTDAGYVPVVTVNGAPADAGNPLGGGAYRAEVLVTAPLTIVVDGKAPRTLTLAIAAGITPDAPAPYVTLDGSDFTLGLKVTAEGKEPRTDVGTIARLTDSTFTLTIPNVTEDKTVNLTLGTVVLPVTVTVGEGIENWTGANTQEYFGTYTGTFTLAEYYTNPRVEVNGQPLTPTESGGTYTVTVSDVRKPLAIVLIAYPNNTRFVTISTDGHVSVADASVTGVAGSYGVTAGADFWAKLAPHEGYLLDNITVEPNTQANTLSNDTIKLSNVQEDVTVSITAKKIVLPVTVTPSEGITVVSAPTEVEYGADTAITFTLGAGYGALTATVNGITATPTLADGVYRLALPHVTEAKTVALNAQPIRFVTISTNELVSVADASVPAAAGRYCVTAGTDFWAKIALREGCLLDTLNVEPSTQVNALSNDTLTLSNVTADVAVRITAKKKLLPVTVTPSEGITVVSAPTEVEYGADTAITFTLAADYGALTATVNGTSATPTLEGGIYRLALPHVTEAKTVALSALPITYTVTVSSVPGITDLNAPTEVRKGTNAVVSFKVADGYHDLYVALNGEQVKPAVADGIYSVALNSVAAPQTVTFVLYAPNTLLVIEDGMARSTGNVDTCKLMVYNNGSAQMETFLKFDLAAYATISSAKLHLPIAGFSASAKDATWHIDIAGNSWTGDIIPFASRPQSIADGRLATTAKGVDGLITEGAARWMEQSMTLRHATITLDAAKIQAYLAAGNTTLTLRLYNTAAVGTVGGETDIASRNAANGRYGMASGVSGATVTRTDLLGVMASLEVQGTAATSVTTLAALTVDGVQPADFAAGKRSYAFFVPEGTTAYPAIVATATDPKATVSAISYAPATFHPDSANVAAFTVTNGSNSATYTLTFAVDKSARIFNLIMSRISAENEKGYSVASLDAKVAGFLTTLTSDGRFSDISYADRDGRNKTWQSLTHIDRLKDMAFAYTMSGSRYFESAAFFDTLKMVLGSWANNHPSTCDNWWFNAIPEPQRLGIALIQLRKGKQKVDAALEAKLIADRMKPTTTTGWGGGYAGANKVDIATHRMYSACLLKDGNLLNETLTDIFSVLAFTTAEGLQYDYSYFQHGAQLYIGGYGDEIIKGNTLIASYVAGTEFALGGDKLDKLSTFIRNTWLPSMRGQHLAWNTTGRGMSRPGTLNHSGAALYTDRMQTIDPANADEFANASKRLRGQEAPDYGVQARSTSYFVGDYTLHVRPTFSADVRLVSTRTKTIEYGNNENLKCFYLSDGSMSIGTDGDEYADIFPAWNWTRIPGVTSPQKPFEDDPAYTGDKSDGSANPYLPKFGNSGGSGIATFAGGASDSLYSVTAFTQPLGALQSGSKYTGVGANKGWFFFDSEIVCLGANIASHDNVKDYDIFTTLNQCLLSGDVTVSAGGNVSTLPENVEQPVEAPDYVLHNGIAYLFPQGGSVGVANKAQAGSWYSINHSYSQDPESRNVFTLYLNHGKQVQNGTYAYIIAPGLADANAVQAYKAASGIRIVANTPDLQAVANDKLAQWQAIFYKAGTLTDGDITLTVDKPCALILKRTGLTYTLHVANPAHTAQTIRATLNLPYVADEVTRAFTYSSGTYVGATQATTITGEADAVVMLSIVAGEGISVVDPAGTSPYILPKGEPYIVKFALDTAFENPTALVDGAPATPARGGDGLYGLRLPALQADVNLVLSASRKVALPDPPTGINDPNDPVVRTQYYNLMGRELKRPDITGAYIVKRTHASGRKHVVKELVYVP